MNRIPNCHLLTNKLGLLNSLQRFERVQMSINPMKTNRMCSADFLPETYRLDDQLDRRTFLSTYKGKDKGEDKVGFFLNFTHLWAHVDV